MQSREILRIAITVFIMSAMIAGFAGTADATDGMHGTNMPGMQQSGGATGLVPAAKGQALGGGSGTGTGVNPAGTGAGGAGTGQKQPVISCDNKGVCTVINPDGSVIVGGGSGSKGAPQTQPGTGTPGTQGTGGAGTGQKQPVISCDNKGVCTVINPDGSVIVSGGSGSKGAPQTPPGTGPGDIPGTGGSGSKGAPQTQPGTGPGDIPGTGGAGTRSYPEIIPVPVQSGTVTVGTQVTGGAGTPQGVPLVSCKNGVCTVVFPDGSVIVGKDSNAS